MGSHQLTFSLEINKVGLKKYSLRIYYKTKL